MGNTVWLFFYHYYLPGQVVFISHVQYNRIDTGKPTDSTRDIYMSKNFLPAVPFQEDGNPGASKGFVDT